ncbi:MAG: hypothetical protein KA116_07345 [Proteobacteria bacterium]|nr:hypothetical protein [Pseudomonadota bacterium]
MKNVQHIFWSNGKNTLTLDTLLWKFPQKLLASLNLKELQVSIYNALVLDWGDGPVADLEEIKSWIRCGSSFQFIEKSPRFALEFRSKNSLAQELPTLLLSNFQHGTHSSPQSIYQSKILEFHFTGPEGEALWEKILEALKKRPNLNTLWDPVVEEMRVVKDSQYDFWIFSRKEFSQWKDVQAIIESEYENQETHPLKNHHLLIEKQNVQEEDRPRYIQNQLGNDLWSNLYGKEFKAQADFLFFKPKKWRLKQLPEFSPKRMVAKSLALSGKPLGNFVEIESHSVFPRVESLSSLPVSSQRFYNQKNGEHLFFVGPWDANNKVVEQSVEKWLEAKPDLLIRSILWDSSENWVYSLLEIVFKLPGWRFEKSAFLNFLNAINEKSFSSNYLIFWGEIKEITQFQDGTFPAGLRAGILGSRDRDGVYQVDGFEESALFFSKLKSELKTGSDPNSLASKLKTVIRENPQIKAASYGYDRASAFPDQYSLKAHVVARGTNQEWIESQWLNRTGSKIWSSTMGSFFNIASHSRKVATGENLNVVAGQRLRASWSHNPAKSAAILIDDALRSLLSQGASLKRINVNLWIGYGRRLSGPTQASLSLFFESFKSNLLKLGMSLDSLKMSPMAHSEGLDAFLMLQSQEGLLEPQDSFSGFRMEEESIYSVGPRPFQMESGSTVLRFVRVYSNFVSSIEIEKQIQLYYRLSELQRKGIISSLSSVTERGIAGSLLNMSLWGSRGAQLRPGLSAIELFSASPGRLLVGVLPQDAKTFESELKGEQVLMVGTVKGDRLWGLKLSEMVKVMTDYEKDHIA